MRAPARRGIGRATERRPGRHRLDRLPRPAAALLHRRAVAGPRPVARVRAADRRAAAGRVAAAHRMAGRPALAVGARGGGRGDPHRRVRRWWSRPAFPRAGFGRRRRAAR